MMITRLRDALAAKRGVRLTVDDTDLLLDEINDLEEKVPRPPEPPNHKGITYSTSRNGWIDRDRECYHHVAALIVSNLDTLDDRDFEPIMALKDRTPETVADVLNALVYDVLHDRAHLNDHYEARIRSAMLLERTR